MKTEIITTEMSDDELTAVLKNSLYPGAADSSIKMVRAYCKAAKLDPMQKPVHIVQMQVSTGRKDNKGWDIKENRDVIMPGIGLYRIQAARSGGYAGVSDPEFGDDVTEKLGNVSITFPAWCRMTVKRIMANGYIAEFSAKEFWKENYATKGRECEPNAMWAKRPYAQLAKCAEAQALRKAFPEIGAQPTADEMEGKEIDDEFIRSDASENHKNAIHGLQPYSDAQLSANIAAWQGKIDSGKITPEKIITMISSKYILSDAQKERIHALVPIEAEVVIEDNSDFLSDYEAAEEYAK